MKKTVIFLIAVFAASLGYSQCEAQMKGLSNAEKFANTSGKLIQMEFLEVGTVRKVDIKVIHYLDLNSLDSLRALRFEYLVVSTYNTHTKVATVDTDEIDGLINAVKMIQAKLVSANLINRTEVTYRTRGEFEVGCYLKNQEWTAYLQLVCYDSDSRVRLKEGDLAELLALLEIGKGMLE
ncbi:hypothetical protein G3O08_02470 [Cryomorpha ignava]|uniref:DUF4252 domain-containing protein n=1 Tax=Cryomorpha ignava TaxID=101383 RepID=A0A7K3WNT1_9FLAO|nr:hypothetical protein [Cryomorpha ignava]NEN22365.1 hypothetical protein [Cryomorpha ignava]